MHGIHVAANFRQVGCQAVIGQYSIGVNAFVIWTELNPIWKCSKSGTSKQSSDIKRLFLLHVGTVWYMAMQCVGRRSLSIAVTLLLE